MSVGAVAPMVERRVEDPRVPGSSPGGSTARGFFAIGVEHGKSSVNVGTLWRSANLLGASYIFTVGRRYQRQSSDTMQTWRHVPLFHFATIEHMRAHMPYDCLLVGVEMHPEAIPLHQANHPERAVYLLGAEDHGLTHEALDACQRLVILPGERSMNVAVAGSIVMYDRHVRGTRGMRRLALTPHEGQPNTEEPATP